MALILRYFTEFDRFGGGIHHCAHILIPHESSFILVFWQEKWLKNGWWETTPYAWSFGPNWPRSFKNADFQSIFARSASAVTHSEKKLHQLRHSGLRQTYQVPCRISSSSYILDKSDPCSSHTVSLRQLSFLFHTLKTKTRRDVQPFETLTRHFISETETYSKQSKINHWGVP